MPRSATFPLGFGTKGGTQVVENPTLAKQPGQVVDGE